MYSFVVDFGGTYIKIGMMKNGIVKDFVKIPSYTGKDFTTLIKQIEKEFEKFLDSWDLKLTDFLGVGVAIPGIVDFDKKEVLSVNKKYEHTIGFSFELWAKQRFNLPLILENDAKAALIGEVTFGSAKDVTDAVLMTFGTGIGTAAIMNSQLLRGKHHQAGCLGGHITTGPENYICTCGNIGCIESTASNWALPIVAKERNGFSRSLLAEQEVIDYFSVIQCAEQNDPFSQDFLHYLLDQWSSGIVNLIHAYDPETVILSGGLMNSRKYVLSEIELRVKKRAWTPWGDIQILVAENPNQSVLFGLDALLIKQYYRSDSVAKGI